MNKDRDAAPVSNLIDLRQRRQASLDPAAAARSQVAVARRTVGETESEFADRLDQLVTWEVTPELVTCWETDITPPGDVVMATQFLVGVADEEPVIESGLAGIEAVFRTRSEFVAAMPPEQLLDGVHVVEAVGLSHNLLCQQFPTPKLLKLLNGGAEVEMLFLEPHGESIAQREEEEHFAIGSLSTLTELNINTLLTQVRPKLDPAALPRLKIGTYDQTIRLNLLFLDDEICICQPYLHAVRGVDAPTLVVRNNERDGVYDSLRACYSWLRNGATFQ